MLKLLFWYEFKFNTKFFCYFFKNNKSRTYVKILDYIIYVNEFFWIKYLITFLFFDDINRLIVLIFRIFLFLNVRFFNINFLKKANNFLKMFVSFESNFSNVFNCELIESNLSNIKSNCELLLICLEFIAMKLFFSSIAIFFCQY